MEIDISGKGPVLGNPLRFLTCYSDTPFVDIRSSYRELIRVRLADPSATYVPPDDPFLDIDPLVLDRQTVQKTWDLLQDAGVRLCARALYPKERATADDVIAGDHALYTFARMSAGGKPDLLAAKEMRGMWRGLIRGLSSSALIDKTDSAGEGVNPAELAEIRELCWEALIASGTKAAIALIRAGSHTGARDVQTVMEETVRGAVEDGLIERSVSPILHEYCVKCSAPAETKIRGFRESGWMTMGRVTFHKFARAWLIEYRRVSAELRGVVKTFGDRYAVLSVALEDTVFSLREIAIEINNEREEYAVAVEFLEEAEHLAVQRDIVSKLAEDAVVLKGNLQAQAQQQSVVVGDLARSSRIEIASGRIPEKDSGGFSNWIWGAFFWIAVLVIIGICDDDSDRSGRPAHTSNYAVTQNSVPTTATGLQPAGPPRNASNIQYAEQLRTSIERNRRRLDSLENEVQSMDALLQNLAAKITRQEELLESLATRYESRPTEALADEHDLIYGQYGGNVDRYNAIVAKRNAAYETHQKVLTVTNKQVDQYNAAIR